MREKIRRGAGRGRQSPGRLGAIVLSDAGKKRRRVRRGPDNPRGRSIAQGLLLKESLRPWPSSRSVEKALRRGAVLARPGRAKAAAGGRGKKTLSAHALAARCESRAFFQWASSMGADWRALDAKGNGFEHWAAEAGNRTALRFWMEIGGEMTRKNKRGETALEVAIASRKRAMDVIIQLWGDRESDALDKALARGVYGLAKRAMRDTETHAFFAKLVGVVCRLRPAAARPNRELSTAWDRAFPGPERSVLMLIETVESQAIARMEAREIELTIRSVSVAGSPSPRREGEGHRL